MELSGNQRSHGHLTQQQRIRKFRQQRYSRHSTRCSRDQPVTLDEEVELRSYFRQHWPEEHSVQIEDRCTRNRINSAIFVSSEGKGFDSIEFLRRYGSQSVLCRKARSAENITSADQRRILSGF
ncbi:hypothetical protein DMENIID0001_103440 [Sergentomyia squamirostris]